MENDIAFNATNSTPYYNLPQFTPTDKPAWLVDFNGAMVKLDNALHEITTSGGAPQIKTINGQSLIGTGNIEVQPKLVSGSNISTINGQNLLTGTPVSVQSTLVSGTNIKTINGTSLLGSGNITIENGTTPELKTINNQSLTGTGNITVQDPLVSGTNIKTINGSSILGSGNITISGSGGGVTISEELNATDNLTCATPAHRGATSKTMTGYYYKIGNLYYVAAQIDLTLEHQTSDPSFTIDLVGRTLAFGASNSMMLQYTATGLFSSGSNTTRFAESGICSGASDIKLSWIGNQSIEWHLTVCGIYGYDD